MAPSRYLVAVFAALLASLPATAAGVSWGYSVSVEPANLIAGRWHFEDHPDGMQQVVLWNPDYGVGFQGLAGQADGSAQVQAAAVNTFGVGFDSGMGDFDPTIHLFDVGFELTDLASGQSGAVVFKGTLSGLIDQFGASLEAGFDPMTQSVTLGDNTYDVQLLPFSLSQLAADGAVQGDAVPTVMAQVDVREVETMPDTPNPPPNPPSGVLDTPEPGTLALAGTGLACLGLVLRRNRGRVARR